MPFGKLHSRNPEIIKYASCIGRTPSALAMKLTNIASLDQAITSTGRKGLKGASEADKKMWEEMQNDWEHFALESENAVAKIDDLGPGFDSEFVDYTGTNKNIQTTARVGQNFFRKIVLSAYSGKCCISALSDARLLVASHIVPWRVDDSNRLNPRNGLLLSVLHDKAFDLGLITIDEDFTIRLSSKCISNDRFFDDSLRYFEGKKMILPEKFLPDAVCLAYHRENIFQQ